MEYAFKFLLLILLCLQHLADAFFPVIEVLCSFCETRHVSLLDLGLRIATRNFVLL